MFSQANKIRIALIILSAVVFAGCDVEQTQEGKMPEVEVTGGQLPKVDVKTPDVEVGTKAVEVQVPDVDVKMPDEQKTE